MSQVLINLSLVAEGPDTFGWTEEAVIVSILDRVRDALENVNVDGVRVQPGTVELLEWEALS